MTHKAKNAKVFVNGVEMVPMAEGVFVGKKKPWYIITSLSGRFFVEVTDRNGVEVSFYLKADSESLIALMACDPFGENVFGVVDKGNQDDQS